MNIKIAQFYIKIILYYIILYYIILYYIILYYIILYYIILCYIILYISSQISVLTQFDLICLLKRNYEVKSAHFVLISNAIPFNGELFPIWGF